MTIAQKGLDEDGLRRATLLYEYLWQAKSQPLLELFGPAAVPVLCIGVIGYLLWAKQEQEKAA